MTGKQIRFKNRESWLHFIVEEMRPKFADIDFPLPEKIRVAIGFTSKGKSKKVIGQCWDKAASSDDHYEIFIVPWLNSKEGHLELEIAAVLAHELIHTRDLTHGKTFKTISKTIGLIGPATATRPGPLFRQLIKPILDEAGSFPHGVLNTEGPLVRTDGEEGDSLKPLTDAPPSQLNRYIQCKCDHCGYITRLTRKWLDEVGAPFCPNHGEMTPDAKALAKLHEAEDIRNAKKAKLREERAYRDPGTRKSKKDIAPEEIPDTGPLTLNPFTPSIAERESWRTDGGDVVHRFDEPVESENTPI